MHAPVIENILHIVGETVVLYFGFAHLKIADTRRPYDDILTALS